MFYRDIIINEEIKNFSNAYLDQIKRYHAKEENIDQISLASGDIFTSIGRTHPEKIDMARVQAISVSKDIVKEFNKFFDGVFKEMVSHNNSQGEKYFNVDWVKAQKDINVLVYTLDLEIQKLMKSEGISYDEALQFIKKDFLPGSLTEEGCKEMLRIRMTESKIYNTYLKKMLKVNYKSLSLTEAEAKALSNELSKDNTPEQRNAQAFIKEILSKKRNIKNFKVKNSIYDFRTCGGGVLFLSNDNEDIRFTDNPAKMLTLLFKYDAVVSAHGNSNMEKSGNNIRSSIKSLISHLKSNYRYYSKLSVEGWADLLRMYTDKRTHNMIAKRLNKDINDITDEDIVSVCKPQVMKNLKQLVFLTINTLNKMLKEPEKATKYYLYLMDELSDIQDNTPKSDNIININIKDIKSRLKKLKHSLSNLTNEDQDDMNIWSIANIDTLKRTGIYNVVDLVRQLREEGFRNVLLLNCNPGHHKLPKDIVNDKKFTVTFGINNVLKEAMDYVELSLLESEAKIEYLIESNELVISNQSIDELFYEYNIVCEQMILEIDGSRVKEKLKLFGKKIISIIINIWKAIVKFFRHIYEIIISKIKGNKPITTKKPMEISCISISGNRAKLNTLKTKDREEAYDFIKRNSMSIKSFVDKQSARIVNDSRRITSAIENNRFK